MIQLMRYAFFTEFIRMPTSRARLSSILLINRGAMALLWTGGTARPPPRRARPRLTAGDSHTHRNDSDRANAV
jgi:hypothetical protein